MSISFVEFKKLLNPAIPEKFKLIYEILYYYKIDVEELLGLTTDRIIYEEIDDGIRQGIKLNNGSVIELQTDLFERIINFLEFNDKLWGERSYEFSRKIFVFESNKKGQKYTIPTLYKKFKEHCLKAGILRDLALGSLINTDVGRFISIINSELSIDKEKMRITFFSFASEDINNFLRYYIIHLNFEEIIGYKKERVGFNNFEYGIKEIFLYPFIDIKAITFLSSNLLPPMEIFHDNVKESNAIFLFGKPTLENKESIIELVSFVHNEAQKKFVSFVLDDTELLIKEAIEEILKSKIRPWLQYIPLVDLQTIDILTTVENFFIFILEKFNSVNSEDDSFITTEASK